MDVIRFVFIGYLLIPYLVYLIVRDTLRLILRRLGTA